MKHTILTSLVLLFFCFGLSVLLPFEIQASSPAPFDIYTGPTKETFKALNPLDISGSDQAGKLSTPGGVVSRILEFAFPIAGMILFMMFIWGGFEILSSATSKKTDAGKQRITAAIAGFLLLFSAYWIAQIIEYVFGIVIV